MDLSQLKPKAAKFILDSMGEEKEFHLRPVNLSDEVWLSENFEDMSDVFDNLRMDKIARIVFRLLTDESKLFFQTQDIETVDEEGNKKTIKVGGVKMLQMAISGYENKINVVVALLECIGFSRPEVPSDSGGTAGAVKKKLSGM